MRIDECLRIVEVFARRGDVQAAESLAMLCIAWAAADERGLATRASQEATGLAFPELSRWDGYGLSHLLPERPAPVWWPEARAALEAAFGDPLVAGSWESDAWIVAMNRPLPDLEAWAAQSRWSLAFSDDIPF